MSRTISTRNIAKASTVKPLTGDKYLGIDPYTCFYLVEDGDKTEEGEEAEKYLSFTIKA